MREQNTAHKTDTNPPFDSCSYQLWQLILCSCTTPACHRFSIICLLLFDQNIVKPDRLISVYLMGSVWETEWKEDSSTELKWQACWFQNERHFLLVWLLTGPSSASHLLLSPSFSLTFSLTHTCTTNRPAPTWTNTHSNTVFFQQLIGISSLPYLLVSPISYSLSLSSSKMSTSSLPVVERLLFLLMLSLASVMARRSPLLHSIGSSRMAAEEKGWEIKDRREIIIHMCIWPVIIQS